MDRFGLLSEYLQDEVSGFDNSCFNNLYQSDGDPMFFSQQPDPEKLEMYNSNASEYFKSLEKDVSSPEIILHCGYECIVINQKLKEPEVNVEGKEVEIYCPQVEDISDDEVNGPKHDIR